MMQYRISFFVFQFLWILLASDFFSETFRYIDYSSNMYSKQTQLPLLMAPELLCCSFLESDSFSVEGWDSEFLRSDWSVIPPSSLSDDSESSSVNGVLRICAAFYIIRWVDVKHLFSRQMIRISKIFKLFNKITQVLSFGNVYMYVQLT